MGYSTPKKQLDLKEFLSQTGKKSTRRQFTFRSTQTPEPAETAEDASPERAAHDTTTGD